MKIGEIAERLNYDVFGDENLDITSVLFPECADEGSIAVIRKKAEINISKAPAALTEPHFYNTDKTLVFCNDSIENAAVKTAELLIKEGSLYDYSKVPEYTCRNNVLYGKNVNIGEGTLIQPFSSVGDNVTIGKGCIIEPNVYIGSGVVIGNNVVIHSGAKIGASSSYTYYDRGQCIFHGAGKVIISDNVEIFYNTVIQRGTFSDTVIGCNTVIGDLTGIGHDVIIGGGSKITAQTGITGEAKIGSYVTVYGQSGIGNGVVIGDRAVIMARSAVTKNIPEGTKVSGMFAREHIQELKYQAKLRKLAKEE